MSEHILLDQEVISVDEDHLSEKMRKVMRYASLFSETCEVEGRIAGCLVNLNVIQS
jgi:hypothetical protein